ncbi:MAG: GGDEF domain-containing protein [Castellaniella sp.]|uniref:sensor domain-containing diguanylate cyclase n=1 Tax=Castellaniella sp. TaxID=1955812 RepID=UPI00121A9B50|nr:sensor domain-containing diguanylate cyclase [Castellaniella sp.]TAN26059.1 MAG: GGDEF domain-containing protein [Castellaniella sp.]
MRTERRSRINLRHLMLLLAITSGIIMLLAGLLGAYQVQRQQLMDSTLASNEAFAVKLATTTTDLLRRAQQTLAYSADILQRGKMNPAVVRAEIDRLREQGMGFNSVTVAGVDGLVTAVAPENLALLGRRIDSAESLMIRRLRIPLISKPLTTALGRLAIVLSQPLFGENYQYLGYLAATLYLKTEGGLHRLIGEQYFHDGTYVYVVDSSRRLLYHPLPDRIGTLANDDPVIDAVLQGRSGQQHVVDQQGNDMLDGYAYVAAADWGIIVQRPTEVALRRLDDLMQRVLWFTLGPAVLLLVLLWTSSRWISRPLEQLARIVRSGYEDGMVRQLESVHGWYYEAQQLKYALLASLGTVSARMGKLRTDAHTDPLTGLGNRRGLDAILRSWQELNRGFAVISLDIDLFKSINDTYGHDVGDRVIRSVGEWMQAQARQGDALFRTGGEEFLALLPDVGLEHAASIAERLRMSIADASILPQQQVTVSVGVAIRTGGTAEAVLKAADQALYCAKQEGRNRVVVAGRAQVEGRAQ